MVVLDLSVSRSNDHDRLVRALHDKSGPFEARLPVSRNETVVFGLGQERDQRAVANHGQGSLFQDACGKPIDHHSG